MVKDNEIIGRSDDATLMETSMYSHAELEAIESASRIKPGCIMAKIRLVIKKVTTTINKAFLQFIKNLLVCVSCLYYFM